MNDFTPQEIEIINECRECDNCICLENHLLTCRTDWMHTPPTAMTTEEVIMRKFPKHLKGL